MSIPELDISKLSDFQYFTYLLYNAKGAEREQVLRALVGEAVVCFDPSATQVMRSCKRILDKTSLEERRYFLKYALDTLQLLEQQRVADAQLYSTIILVATVPRYLKGANDQTPPNVGSLANYAIDIMMEATDFLYMVIPFISVLGARLFTKALRKVSKPGTHVCIISQLMSYMLRQNLPGMRVLNAAMVKSRMTVDIRSPTDEQAKECGVHALIHDKDIINSVRALQGTANWSEAGFEKAMEGGVVFAGPIVREMKEHFEWRFHRHKAVDLDVLLQLQRRMNAQ